MALSSVLSGIGSFVGSNGGFGSLTGGGGLGGIASSSINSLIGSATGIPNFDLGLGSDFNAESEAAWNKFSQEIKNGDIKRTYTSEEVDESGNVIKVSNNVKYSFQNSNAAVLSDYGKRASQLPNIFGMPFTFLQESDPEGRVFSSTILSDLPILTLIPGLPKFNGGMASLAKLLTGDTTGGNSGIMAFLHKNGIGSSFGDQRYYTFESNYSEYYSYVNTMLGTLHMRMGLAEKFNGPSMVGKTVGNAAANAIDAAAGLFGTGDAKSMNVDKEISIYEFSQDAGMVSGNLPAQEMTLSYYIEDLNGSALQDSVSSSYGSSSIANSSNSISDEVMEMQYLTGAGSGSSTNILQKLTNGIKQQRIAKQVNKVLTSSAGEFASADSNLLDQIKQTQNGVRVCFPDLWKETSYQRNVGFRFKFFSPYGDPASIFKYVYVPFVSLLCFALPRQGATSGYVSPFLVRADVPGMATIEMGAVSSFDFTKGGSENLWTKEGYPRCIECTMTITDLYPYLMMTKSINVLKANPGFTLFLDNMAGIGVHINKFNLNMETYINSFTQRLAATDDYINNFLSDTGSKFQSIANAGGPFQIGGKFLNTFRGLF